MATTPATPPAVSPYTVTDGITYSPTTDEGNGILPPFIRGAGHLICTLLVMSVEGQTLMTPEEVHNEVAAASAHFNRITNEACRNISHTSKTAITVLKTGCATADAQWERWSEADRKQALRTLANACAAIGVLLDIDLAGLRGTETDAGSTL